jgi:hypothetical protein
MEPLDEETKRNILETRPEASPEDIREYEEILSKRFAVDPSQPAAAPEMAEVSSATDRLAELHEKLFGPIKK